MANDIKVASLNNLFVYIRYYLSIIDVFDNFCHVILLQNKPILPIKPSIQRRHCPEWV